MGAVQAVWLPAFFGGAVAIGATVAIERLGGVRGGLLASLPTSIVPASFAILAGSSDTISYQHAMAAVPVGMMINTYFLWVWRMLPRRLAPGPMPVRLTQVTLASLLAWAVATGIGLGILGLLRDAGISPLIIGFFAFLYHMGSGVVACAQPMAAPRARHRVAMGALLFRGVLAGAVVGIAGAFALYGNPVLAGLASVFPAIFLTVMVSLWWAQGPEVPAGAVGPMMLGSSSVSAFALLSALLVPPLGLIAGTVVAWIGAVGAVTVPASAWLRRRTV